MCVSYWKEPQFHLLQEQDDNLVDIILIETHTFLKMPNSTSKAAKVSVYLFLLSRHVLSI